MTSRGWESTLAPLDRGRQALLARTFAVRPLARLLGRRDLRIPVLGAAGALVAAGLSVLAPVFLFVLGPVLLGVPHVASDVRYLVVRRAMPRALRSAVWAGCAAIVGVRVLEETRLLGGLLAARAELLLGSSWVVGAAVAGAAVAAGAGRRAGARLSLGLPPLLLLVIAAARHPNEARLVFVHVHNLVGVAVWLLLFRRRRWMALLPLATVALCAGWLLLSPLPYEWTGRAHGELAFGLHVLTMSDWIAPGLPVKLAVGLTYSYVFLQSIHYAVWLSWIPQEDTRAEGTLTFRMTARALVRDFGALGLGAIAALGAVVALGALVDVQRARALYLSLAMFHGYLELAMLAYFLMRGGAPGARAEVEAAGLSPARAAA
jgi:hypothetical protein